MNQHKFVKSSLDELARHLSEDGPDVRSAVAIAIGSSDLQTVEAARADLASHFGSIRDAAASEPSHGDVDYVSRVNLVGLYQSALAKVFSRIPALQGYGDRNPIWVVTLIEEGTYKLGSFFKGGLPGRTWPKRATPSIDLKGVEGPGIREGTVPSRNAADH